MLSRIVLFLILLLLPALCPAEPISLKNLAGDDVRPAVPDKGCPAVVLIFATVDCPISNSYAPAVADLYRAFSPRGVVFYLVYCDPDLAPAAAAAHRKDYAYPCDGLLDPQHVLAKSVSANVSAEAVVIGAGGAVVYRGAIDDQYAAVGRKRTAVQQHYLSDALNDVLAGNAVKVRETTPLGCSLEIK